ncbi:MAG TPA: hypothetical protein ENI23_03120 [bacterium]|nr:hypothetical protein [bacterium]
MTNKFNLQPSWERDLIRKAKQVLKHGWGEAIFKVTKDGEKYRTRVELDDDWKKVHYGGTDPE